MDGVSEESVLGVSIFTRAGGKRIKLLKIFVCFCFQMVTEVFY
jgi:hypothetical protein